MSQEVWSESMRSQVESAFYYTLFNSVTAKFAGQCGMVKVTQFCQSQPYPIRCHPTGSDTAFSQSMIFIIVTNSFLVE